METITTGKRLKALREDRGLSQSQLAKKADIICAYFEAVELSGFTRAEARKIFGEPKGFGRLTPEGPRLGLDPKPTTAAEDAFLARFNELESRR